MQKLLHHFALFIIFLLFSTSFLLRLPIYGRSISIVSIFIIIWLLIFSVNFLHNYFHHTEKRAFCKIVFHNTKRKVFSFLRIPQPKPPSPSDIDHLFLLIPLIFFLLAAFISIRDIHGLGIFTEWLLLPAIFGIFAIPKLSLKNIIRTATAAATILALTSFLHWQPFSRLMWPFTNANELAILLASVFILNFCICLHCKAETNFVSKLSRKILNIQLLILLAAIIFTKSFGAILAITVACTFFVWRKSKKAFWLIFSIFVALLIIFSQTPKFTQTLDFTNRSSSTVRIEIWRVATGLIRENPIAGVGLGRFEPEYIKNAYRLLGDRVPFEWNHPQPHNLFLALYLNTGIIGLLSFLFILLIGLKNSGARRIIAIYIIFHGLVDTTMFRADLMFIIILAAYATRLKQTKTNKILIENQ